MREEYLLILVLLTLILPVGFADSFVDNTQALFNLGTFVNTTTNTSGVILDNSSLYSNTVLFLELNNDSAIGETATMVKDLSSYRNNGTMAPGTSWNTAGKYAGAINYSNAGPKNITFPSNDAFNISKNITIEMWYKVPFADATTFMYALCRRRVGLSCSYAIYSGSTANLTSYWTTSGTSVIGPGIPKATAFDGNWHHFVTSYDGSYVRHFFDGVPVAGSVVLTGNLAYQTAPDLLVIGDFDGRLPSLGWRGYQDEIRIFRKNFTTAEIADHYANGTRLRLPSGNFTSRTFNETSNKTLFFTTVSYTTTLPAQTAFILQLSFSNDSATWTSFTTYASGATFLIPAIYVRYAGLFSTDTNYTYRTPLVSSVSIGYGIYNATPGDLVPIGARCSWFRCSARMLRGWFWG